MYIEKLNGRLTSLSSMGVSPAPLGISPDPPGGRCLGGMSLGGRGLGGLSGERIVSEREARRTAVSCTRSVSGMETKQKETNRYTFNIVTGKNVQVHWYIVSYNGWCTVCKRLALLVHGNWAQYQKETNSYTYSVVSVHVHIIIMHNYMYIM